MSGYTHILDRIEGDVAVLENRDGELSETPLSNLPQGAIEGDLLLETADAEGQRRFSILVDETERMRKKARERIQRLQARDPGGDITL